MTITAEEASTKFMSILDQMKDGEAVTITRQGVPVATLFSSKKPEKMTPREAIERIKELRKGVRLDGLSIREMIDEGRR
jgi:prevent-host-death family protein